MTGKFGKNREDRNVRGHAAMLFLMVSVFMPVYTLIFPLISEPAFAEVKEPVISAKSAVMYCENTGETVYMKEPDSRLSMYGCARLMTAMIASQRLPVDKTVTVSGEAVRQPGPSMGLKEGEKVNVEQLLHGALIAGGNDAVYMLAVTVSGNEKTFAGEMNRVAENIGCTGTRFVNATGKVSRGQHTTAHDLLEITRVALSDQTVSKILKTEEYTLPQTNKNKARTIRADQSRRSHEAAGIYAMIESSSGDGNDGALVAGYNKNGLQLYIVILGASAKNLEKDLDKIILYGVQSIDGIRAVKSGDNEGRVRVIHGEKTSVDTYAQSDGYAYIPREGSKDLISTKTVMNERVEAPLNAGDIVGRLDIYVGEEKVNSVPLVVHDAVYTGWLPSYVGISNFMTVVILVILAVITVIFLYILHKRKQARIRRERARQRKIERLALERYMEEEDHRQRNWKF